MSTVYFVAVSMLIAMILFVACGLYSGREDKIFVIVLLFAMFALGGYVYLGYTHHTMAKQMGISFTETFDGYPCSGCGNVVKVDDKHCSGCGAKNIKRYLVVCEKCENWLDDNEYCSGCGAHRKEK